MKRNLLFIGIIVILVIVGVLVYQGLKKEEKIPFEGEISMLEKTLEGKKIAMIVAFKDFRDEEYFVPKEILEAAGAEIRNVSTQIGRALGADGGEIEVDLLLESLSPTDFDGIIFIGGPGCLKYLDNENSYRVAKETVSEGKVIAAICISPVILAKAGVLAGKNATVWSSIMDKSPITILEENGAIYQEGPVVVDGRIVTANGPAAAEEFGAAIINLLK